MSYIYETKGRAREFHSLACNLYTGCGHGCIYCYGADVLHQDRVKFVKEPRPRIDLLKFEREVRRLVEDQYETRPVLLCFVTDPYQPLDTETRLTRRAIEILHLHGLGVIILTKGGKRAMRDFDLLIPGKDQFAVTLTCLDDKESLKWEPGAALPRDRIYSLKRATSLGIETWVSLEPVVNTVAVLHIIEQTHEFVGHYKVGTMNYHPHGATINWPAFAHGVVGHLEYHRCRYYVKKDLARYLGKSEGYYNETDLENVRRRAPHLPIGE